VTRTGSLWDVLAAVATLVPLGAIAGRRWAVAAPLAATVIWVLLLGAEAAPEIGRFTPDALALAAAAGTVLIAAALAEGALRAAADDRALLVVGAGPAAAAVCFGIGLVDQPDLGSGAATALVLAAAAGVGVAALGPSPLRLLVPAALLAGLRGAVELVDPAEALGLVLAAASAALAILPARLAGRGGPASAQEPVRVDRFGHRGGGWLTRTPLGALGLASLAISVAPVPAARLAGALLAAAAVLVVAADALGDRSEPAPYVPVHPWLASELGLEPGEEEPERPADTEPDPGPRAAVLLAAAPGASLVLTGLADVPSPGAPSVAVHVVFAALVLAVAVGLVAGAGRPSMRRADRPSPVEVAIGGLVGWVLLAPGSWRWAVPAADALDAWDRAAAVAAAAGTLVVVVSVAVAVAASWRDRSVVPSDR